MAELSYYISLVPVFSTFSVRSTCKRLKQTQERERKMCGCGFIRLFEDRIHAYDKMVLVEIFYFVFLSLASSKQIENFI